MLFLELVREVGAGDPELAARALQGLRKYQAADRHAAQQERSTAAERSGSFLRDCGGDGPPLVLVPSLINPPHVLDLDTETSLASALAEHCHVLLLDWGPAGSRAGLDIRAHVTERLLPLVGELGEPAVLVGYCLGGTMALGASAAAPEAVHAVATLASPWHFSAYPPEDRAAIGRIADAAGPAAKRLGALPMEVLQASFWSLDPSRVVAKFAALADLAEESPEFRRFVRLEDWANGGEPLPLAAAEELAEGLFGEDRTGGGHWLGGGLPSCPTIHFRAANDRVVPAATAAEGERRDCPAGHVGMIVGRGAAEHLHRPLGQWLASLA